MIEENHVQKKLYRKKQRKDNYISTIKPAVVTTSIKLQSNLL